MFVRGTPREDRAVVNRTQALVLGFFVLVWASLVAIFAAAPETYEQALRLPSGGGGRSAGVGFLVAISAFIVLLVIGVIRRWRWAFWLIVVAFIFGVLRVPASVLELWGVLPAAGPCRSSRLFMSTSAG